MVAGRERTIYFLEPVIVDAKAIVQTIAPGFWDGFLGHVAALTGVQRTKDTFGRTYQGEARTEMAPAADYLYLGKERPKSDWPDATAADGTTGSLAAQNLKALIEYAYLLPVSGTNLVAVLRSSGGASFSALDSWLTHVCPGLPVGGSLYLRPFVRHDQLERLAAAQGATKVHLLIDPHSFDTSTNAGQLGDALEAAQAVGAGGVSVEMTVSFGHASPSELGAENLAKQVQAILGSNLNLKKASATVLSEEGGKLVRDKIDFVRDRVTVREAIGSSEDEEPTPSAALSAMLEATKKFRKNL